ncbi:hypothetical protein ACFZBU_44010 [Embleya sp. NPDC008237]|uniref:hypothetical protein n=1 Tax=unclassified Embleya TaxID=2699296 RepID=UPI0036EF6412
MPKLRARTACAIFEAGSCSGTSVELFLGVLNPDDWAHYCAALMRLLFGARVVHETAGGG